MPNARESASRLRSPVLRRARQLLLAHLSVSEMRWLHLTLRLIVTLGVAARAWLHGLPIQGLLLLGSVVWATSCAISIVLHAAPKRAGRSRYNAVVLLDVLAISMFYWATKNVQSDFYLFYCVPILTAAACSSQRLTVGTSLLAAVAFAVVVLSMPSDGSPYGSAMALTVRVLIPRDLFFFGMTTAVALLLRRATLRQVQAQALLESRRSLDTAHTHQDILRCALTHAVRDAGLSAAAAIFRAGTANPDAETVDTEGEGDLQELLPACRTVIEGKPDSRAAPLLLRGRVAGAIAGAAGQHQSQSEWREYLNALSEQVATALERLHLFDVLYSVGSCASTSLELNEKIDGLLDRVVNGLGFEHATVSLVDEYMGEIRAVRGRNVPPGWLGRSVHTLDDKDIQSHVVRTLSTEIPDDNDPKLDREIWRRYHHERYSRVFAPIISRGRAIGTIEAGCQRARKAFVESSRDAVAQLGRDCGDEIAGKMLHVALELIARHALDISGSVSTSIHVFRGPWPERRLIFQAGAGDADREFLERNRPSDAGLGFRAITSGKPELLRTLDSAHRALSEEGIGSIAAFPLRLGQQLFGLLYIHYERSGSIRDADLVLMEVLAPQIESALQSHLTFLDIARSDQNASATAGLQNVLKALSSVGGAGASGATFDKLLKELAENALYMLDATSVTLYQYFQDQRSFAPLAIVEGDLRNTARLRLSVQQDDAVHEIIEHTEPRFISDVQEVAILSAARKGQSREDRFVNREGIGSCMILVLKDAEDEKVGCLFVNYRDRKDFRDDKTRALKNLAIAVASAIAVAIKVARLSREARGNLELTEGEMEALRAVNRAIVSYARAPDLKATCNILLQEALRVLGSTVGDVTIWNPERQRLDIICEQGYPVGAARTVRFADGVVGYAGKTRATQWHDDVREVDYYRAANSNTRSELAVPMLDQGKLLGVINIESGSPKAFTRRHVLFLESLANQGTIAVHAVSLHQQLEKQLRQALALTAIAAKIQNVEKAREPALREMLVVRLLMTGLTAEQGLAFSRAMLFTSDDGRTLRGVKAIGASSKKEAEDTWRSLGLKQREVEAEGRSFFEWLLDDAEELTIKAARKDVRPTELDRRVEGLVLTVEEDYTGPFTITQNHPLRRQLSSLYEGAHHCAIACVPIRSRTKLIALLVLDRRFLHDEHWIDSIYGPISSNFAELATMTIEASRLRAQLADEQQLADWRFATHRIAHSFKSQLVSIQQTKKSLRESLRARDFGLVDTYLRKFDGLVAKTEQLLREFDYFARPVRLEKEPIDLAQGLTQLVSDLAAIVECEIELRNPRCGGIWVEADRRQFPHMFFDLVVNADRAMKRARTSKPTIRIAVAERNGFAEIHVSDNGPGVAPEIDQRIFEPFETWHDGSGLGLYIIRDLIQRHHGFIEYFPGEPGARFVVRLPVSAGAGVARSAFTNEAMETQC
jgi:signal transduction histidine kinase